MAVQVLMPTFGMTDGEAVITRWLKAVGEPVAADEALLEAETEKATLEVPAPADGILLSIEAAAGQAVPYKGLLAWIGRTGEALAGSAASQPASVDPATAPAESEEDGWVKASPLARRVAAEHGIDLHALHGSGPGGRIVEADVQQALLWLVAGSTGQAPSPAAPSPAQAEQPALPAADEVLTLSPVRRLAAERLAESFRTAPHFYLQMEIRAARLQALREELVAVLESVAGARLSYTDLLVRAVSTLLPRHPLLNATWLDGNVRTYARVNLGVAAAAPQGLLVPVIHGADALSLAQIIRQRDYLVRQARAGKLTPADLSGGTFTLTNLGMYGVDTFIPVLNPPQSAILAAGSIAERPVGVAGQVVLQPTLNLTLAVDHRVADGVQAAEFLRDLRELLEAPSRLLI